MEKQYETLDVYYTLAKKMVSKFASPFIRNEILNNQEALSEIAEAIMTADWKWDSTRTGHNGQSKTKYSYRNQCGLWAIKTYTTKRFKKKKETLIHNSKNEDIDHAANIPCKESMDPCYMAIEKEEKEILEHNIASIINSDILSDKQKDQIKQYYFDNKTLLEIGKQYGVTREAIRQNIQKGLSKIRKYA